MVLASEVICVPCDPDRVLFSPCLVFMSNDTRPKTGDFHYMIITNNNNNNNNTYV